jgi:hypothetical protein
MATLSIPPFSVRWYQKGKPSLLIPILSNHTPTSGVFLEAIHRIGKSVLDNIIEFNDLMPVKIHQSCNSKSGTKINNRHSLPLCAQKMLANGVSQYQRVSCFRLAVHLKRLGLPFDHTASALAAWALKNQPINSKEVIPEHEIIEQTKCGFNKDYRGYGCNSEAVIPFCNSDCPIWARK